MEFIRKNKGCQVCAVSGFCASSMKLHTEVGPIMDTKLYGVHKENDGFHVWAVLAFCVNSLKLYKEWAPVLRAEGMLFIRKLKESMCVRCWDVVRTR